MGCFTREQVCALTGNYNTAGTLLKSYLKKGYVRSVKRNLYVAVNLADGEPAVSKFRIGSAVTQTAYISHHAAFEYYGCANQVSYQVEVSSETPFSAFDFNGDTFVYFASRISAGIVTRPDGVRVTDMERTLLDGIHDYEKVMGLEELLRCIALIPAVTEDVLLDYLGIYGKQVLYQKAGYILRHYQGELNLSDSFFDECAAHIGKSTRYLTASKNGVYDKEWRLVVPEHLMSFTAKGADEYAEL
jgi:predicted transcriptional regulator of viral defense system